MRSGWVDSEAQAAIDRYARDGIGPDLALRVYTTRLLGRDPKLVLHGGGNTSVKTTMPDLLGEEVAVLCVKGSGSDMAAIEPAGLPAVRLDRLRKLRARAALTDEDMVRVQRENLLDPPAPNPSVETLLHAFLPHKFVDHTHANAILSLVDQPDGEAICAEVYDGRMSVVPYVMPGFALAKVAADVYDARPGVEGLILHKHGIFTFGADAREAYERMIALVTLAEERLKQNRKAVFVTAQLPQAIAPLGAVAPILRGACSLKDEKTEGAWRRLILDFRSGPAILNFVNGADIARYGQAGVVTPDHTIRTKNWPLIVAAPERGRTDDFKRAAQAAAKAFIERYRDYFARHNARVGGIKRALDPLPRVALVPASACSASDARRRTPRSPPISRPARSRPSPTPRRSAASNRFRKPTCSTWNIGRSNRPSSARRRRSRSPGRSPPSPAPAARSARRPPRRSPRRAPRWPCSTSTRAPPRTRRRRSAARRAR